mgnify:CR=1 FL=1
MNSSSALQFLAHEAKRCRDRDACEAFCLLLPALCRVLALPALDDVAALVFERDFHDALRALNVSPLVEAHCAECQWPEAVRECQLEEAWCAQCQRARRFLRAGEAVEA